MKKTYSAPELENIKLSSMQFLAASPEQLQFNPGEDGDGTVLSKGFSGGLWEDDTEE